jgi:hypothetical protein
VHIEGPSTDFPDSRVTCLPAASSADLAALDLPIAPGYLVHLPGPLILHSARLTAPTLGSLLLVWLFGAEAA